MPPPRSKTTCHQCRARKIRCGGGPSPCTPCARSSLQCSFDPTITRVSPPRLTKVSGERRRGVVACNWCRSQKTKCSGGTPCMACQSRVRRCEYNDPQLAKHSGTRESGQVHQPGQAMEEDGRSQNDQRQPAPGAELTFGNGDDSSMAARNIVREVADINQIIAGSSPASTHNDSNINNRRSAVAVLLPLPPIYEQMHLMVEYFLYIYPIPQFSFLNKDLTTHQCLDGTLEDVLALALCAVTVQRLPQPKYSNSDAGAWTRQAEDLIWAQLEYPSITSVQALLLITQFRIHAGEFKRAYMLFSIAARSVSALRLNYDHTDTDTTPVLQETHRRLIWAVMLMDMYFSVGLSEYELCPHEIVHVKLPCREEEFCSTSDVVEVSNASSSQPTVTSEDLLSLIIQGSSLRRDILRLSRQLVLATIDGSGGMARGQIEMIVDNIRTALRRVAITPGYSVSNLEAYAQTQWLPRFIVGHLGWHECYCDLTRLFLAGYVEAAPSTVLSSVSPEYAAAAIRECLLHARAILTIIRDLSQLESSGGVVPLKILEIDVAVCGFHASRILLFAARSSHRQLLSPAESSELTLDKVLEQTAPVLHFLKTHFRSSNVGERVVANLEKEISRATGDEGVRGEGEDDDLEAGGFRGSEDWYDQHLAPSSTRFARAIQGYQRLGGHSVLRLARFEEIGPSNGRSGRSVSHAPRSRNGTTASPGTASIGAGNPSTASPEA